MKKIENRKAMNIIIITIVIAIFAIAIVYLAPIFKDISTKEGQLQFKEKIDNLGPLGILLLFALQVAQIFLVIIPGEPIELLAGMCYGTLGGTIFLLVSVFIITAVIEFVVGKFGKKFVYDTFNKEKIEKIENNKILKDPKKVEIIMIILFLIPGTPKDLLVYIGSLLPIRKWRFVLISTFARFPSIISSTIAGENLVNGNLNISIFAYVASIAFTVIVVILINIFDKNNETKETLKSLK